MKAIVHTEYGTADVLRYTDVPRPAIGDEEVLVRVRAASLNRGDLAVLHGSPTLIRLASGPRRPRQPIPGRAVAGTVEAAGAKVTGLRVGEEVFGETNGRGFAEYVAVPAARLAAKPAGVTFERAATLPVAGTTALTVIRAAEAGPGTSVLVNGASGGVGTFAVQLAKALGAEVTAVCSPRNAEQARALGADHVIDYTREDFTTGKARYDAIVDLVGNHSLAAFRRRLTPTGVFVSSTDGGGPVIGPLARILGMAVISPFVRHRLRNPIDKSSVEDLTHLAELVAAGTITPAIEATYPLAETAAAVRRIETEHARGKIVLTV